VSDYKRPSEGFRYVNGGLKTNSVPDNIPPNKYAALVNVRSVSDSSMRTRPGMVQLFSTNGSNITDLRAYSTLNTDNKPRFLTRNANDTLFLDTGAQVGAMQGGGISPGAAMIPFRPDESPTPYMYVATSTDYQKFSSPSPTVIQQNAGIAEPQIAPITGINEFNIAFMSLPAGIGTVALGGTASGLSNGARITDTVQGVFHDPSTTGMTTIQVAGGAGLAAGVYLSGAVNAYFWPRLSYEQGAFGRYYPLSTSSATASASGSSIMFNPPQYNGTTDPNVQPIEWATVSPVGAITGYTQPWSGATQDYDMVVLATLFVPAPGNYTININHDDGIIFAIQGATLVSGPFNDHFFNHTQTAVSGYAFAPGSSSVLGGTNLSAPGSQYAETFVVNFPASGAYPIEIDFMQWQNEQTLVALNNGQIFQQATGIGAYQRDMALVIGGNGPYTVEDVFPPLSQALAISGITYLSGTTGQCVVVPSSLGSGPGIDDASVNELAYVNSLRRGALVQIGSEVCYVLDVETGPNGTVCFTTSTVNTHTSSEFLRGVPAIQIFHPTVAVGNSITSSDNLFAVATGIGTASYPDTLNPFASAQPEDYIHLSLNIDNLANLIEAKILLDVGDGSFTENFYYYTIRPNDIALGVQNGLTQLGVAQLVAQRAAIDEEVTAESANQGPTASSAQSATGTTQWSEIKFAINELTRVGNDQTKTLATLSKVQILINASGVVNVAFNSVTYKGGFSPDVGASGAPYLYRVRPRSSVTGAKGNPSPATRYGVNPRRQLVLVFTPSTVYDSQIDTLDIFRYGGTITSWRKIGQISLTNGSPATFFDNYSDFTAAAGEPLEFDNYQPWPSIDIPLNVTATTVTGTLALVTIPSPTNALRYLPGNLVKIGGTNVYTLYTRPVLVSGTTYMFRFVENAGAGTNLPLSIYEPAIAQQRLPYMWGPDANGTVFACGDSLRPGQVYECKSNAPDSAPDTYNQEITPPTEPLMGGEIMDGVSYVASTERWWRMYFQSDGLERYSVVQQSVSRGLAAPYGKCNDGASISWWAKDGIYDTAEGSLTDGDLYNLFPHEGVPGQPVTYGPVTFLPPDYTRAGTFRLETGNGFLYATYQDSSATYHTLVYDRRRKAWQLDIYATPASVVYHPEQQEGTVLSSSALYPMLTYGLINGIVTAQQDSTNDLSAPIPVTVASFEYDGGDLRANEQWGDIYLDTTPNSPTMFITPMSNGSAVASPSAVPQSTTRQYALASLGGGLLANFMGLMVQWTDDFTVQSAASLIHGWQPSFIPKPEAIADRYSDWMPVQPGGGAGFVQGFLLHADTFGNNKSLLVRDADTLTLHAFTPVVEQDGESTLSYSFNTPFIAHLVRIEPQDTVPWRLFDVQWIAEATPELGEVWQTQGTSFGFKGYSHIQRIVGAYAATTPITLVITSFDGQSPAPVVLPATGGQYQKLLQVLTANKGQLYFFLATSTAPFQLFLQDFEVLVGNWGRDGAYTNYRSLGGNRGDKATI
jgi:hypothetical protein